MAYYKCESSRNLESKGFFSIFTFVIFAVTVPPGDFQGS